MLTLKNLTITRLALNICSRRNICPLDGAARLLKDELTKATEVSLFSTGVKCWMLFRHRTVAALNADLRLRVSVNIHGIPLSK